MKLVQKSLLHTGYFILEDGEIKPSFTNDLVREGMNQPFSKDIRKIYAVVELERFVNLIKEFKKEHGIIPQDLVAILRTGFATCGELKQSHNLFIYK